MKHLTFALIIAVLIVTTSCVSSPRKLRNIEEPTPQIIFQEEAAAEASILPVILMESEPPVQETPTEAPLDESGETIPEEPVEAVSVDVGQTEQNVDEVVKTPFQNVDGDVAILFGNVLPRWFVNTAAGLILALFFTLCFISRQKRFTRNYRE